MNAYRWWEFGAVAAYALMLAVVWLWPNNGDDWSEYDEEDCQAVGSVEYTLRDYHRKQSPVRETCDLDDDDRAALDDAFEEITNGWDFWSRR